MLTELHLRQLPCGARIQTPGEAPILLSHAPAQLPCVAKSSLNMPVCHAAELITSGTQGNTNLMNRHWSHAGFNREPYGY